MPWVWIENGFPFFFFFMGFEFTKCQYFFKKIIKYATCFWHSFQTRPEVNLRQVPSIVLKPSLASRPRTRTRPGWWKNRKSHDSVWLGRPGGLTRQNPVTTRWLLFCFFTKTTPFWIFLKIEIDPVTRSKPGTRTLDRTGFKNYDPRSWVPV